jgi:hypothetical protein
MTSYRKPKRHPKETLNETLKIPRRNPKRHPKETLNETLNQLKTLPPQYLHLV